MGWGFHPPPRRRRHVDHVDHVDHVAVVGAAGFGREDVDRLKTDLWVLGHSTNLVRVEARRYLMRMSGRFYHRRSLTLPLRAPQREYGLIKGRG
jgi:hypothetical protein